MKHLLRLIFGWFFLVLGVLGLFLPLLQGILFLAIGFLLLAPNVPVFRRVLRWIQRKYPRVYEKLPGKTKHGLKRSRGKKMKAVFIEEYGGPEVLRLGEQPQPVARHGEVLIKVYAAGMNPRDFMVRQGTYPFKFAIPAFPFVLGSDVAGVVARVGKDVTDFHEGDAVYAMQTTFGGFGAYAEYMAVRAKAVGHKPKNMNFAEAAAVPCAGQTAWQSLLDLGGLKSGQKVLIVGASGSVGSYAVQIAKIFGAGVTGVCSTNNVERVLALGADRVVDYKQERFNDTVKDQDLVFDTLGMESLKSVRPVLKPRGIYVTTVPGGKHIRDALLTALWPWGRRVKVIAVKAKGEVLEKLREEIEAGRIRSEIDTVYPLEAVAEAQRYLRTFHTRGKLILRLRPEP